jgi:hypothetical protein
VVTTLLDLLGALLLVVFAFIVWPPLALLIGGAMLLLASWRIEGGRVRKIGRNRRQGAS